MEVDLTAWVVVVGALTPFLTAIAAKLDSPDWWKGVLSLSWAVIAGVVSGFVDAPSTFELSTALADGAAVWGTHLLTWLGISSFAVAKLNESTATLGIRNPFGD